MTQFGRTGVEEAEFVGVVYVGEVPLLFEVEFFVRVTEEDNDGVESFEDR